MDISKDQIIAESLHKFSDSISIILVFALGLLLLTSALIYDSRVFLGLSTLCFISIFSLRFFRDRLE